MPAIVRADPHVSHDTPTLDVVEAQCLIRMDGDACNAWSHLLLGRVRDAQWITCDPYHTVVMEDLAGEEITPLMRNSQFPLAGRPFRVFNPITPPEMAIIKARAAQLAMIHGVILTGADQAVVAVAETWRFSDTSHGLFGAEVPSAVLGDVDKFMARGECGLVLALDPSTAAEEWTTCQRVGAADAHDWACDKREGAGRDARLSGLRAKSGLARGLFRHAVNDWLESASQKASFSVSLPPPTTDWLALGKVATASAGAQGSVLAPSIVPDATVFEGTASIVELCTAMTRSNMEPLAFVNQFLETNGIDTKSATAFSLRYDFFSLYLMSVVDRYDCFQSATAEHLSRRILQQMRASRENPKNPDYSSHGGYMRHAEEAMGNVATPAFDRYIAGTQQVQAQFWKQNRLYREELAGSNKDKKDKKDKKDAKDPKGDKGKGKGEGG